MHLFTLVKKQVNQLCPVSHSGSAPTHCGGLRMSTTISSLEHRHRITMHHTCGLILGSPNHHTSEIKKQTKIKQAKIFILNTLTCIHYKS